MDSQMCLSCTVDQETAVAIPHLLVEVKFEDWILNNQSWGKAFFLLQSRWTAPPAGGITVQHPLCCLLEPWHSASCPVDVAIVRLPIIPMRLNLASTTGSPLGKRK